MTSQRKPPNKAEVWTISQEWARAKGVDLADLFTGNRMGNLRRGKHGILSKMRAELWTFIRLGHDASYPVLADTFGVAHSSIIEAVGKKTGREPKKLRENTPGVVKVETQSRAQAPV